MSSDRRMNVVARFLVAVTILSSFVGCVPTLAVPTASPAMLVATPDVADLSKPDTNVDTCGAGCMIGTGVVVVGILGLAYLFVTKSNTHPKYGHAQ